MDSQTLDVLSEAYANIDIFFVIAARIIGFLTIIPSLSGTNIPVNVRIGFSVLITFLVFTSGTVTEISYSPTIIGFAMIVAAEFIVGFLLGFSAYIIFSIVYYMGQLIDMQIGFSMVNVLDPFTQLQVPIVGNLLYFVIIVFFVRSGGLNAFIQTVFYSYKMLPIGTAKLLGNYDIYSQFITLMADYITIGIRFSLPIVGSILILDIALGILVKASPQMNIFVVGVPIKLIVGLFLLYVMAPIFSNVYEVLFDESFDAVMTILRGMIT